MSSQQSAAAYASWARTPDRAARLSATWAARDRRIAADYAIPAELEHTHPVEYAKRLEAAKKAYFRGLAAKSVKTRRANAARLKKCTCHADEAA